MTEPSRPDRNPAVAMISDAGAPTVSVSIGGRSLMSPVTARRNGAILIEHAYHAEMLAAIRHVLRTEFGWPDERISDFLDQVNTTLDQATARGSRFGWTPVTKP